MTWRPAFWLVAAGVVAVDQATKQWALHALEPGVNHALWGDFLSIQLVFNSGAAFSLGYRFTWVLTVIAAIVSVAIVVYGKRARPTFGAIVMGAALGGAVGNLVDRLFRDPSFGSGHVVDMIKYGDLFIGNVADVAIVGAAIALVLAGIFHWPVLEGAPQSEAPDGVTAGADVQAGTAPQVADSGE